MYTEIDNTDMTGASGAIPRTDLSRMDAHAKRYYEQIRKRTSDVQAIAANVSAYGFTVDDIRRIKEHIFYNEHFLGGKKPRRFDADYDIAVSWQRLVDGHNIKEMDVTLLKHELLESRLMSEGMSYSDAHEAAEEQYNFKKYTIELDKEAGIV